VLALQLERTWKDDLYQEFARIGKCLSSPRRLELLDLLAQAPKSVYQLADCTGMSVANVSQHLQTMHEARLVRFNKKRNYVFYELAEPSVANFMVSLHQLCEKQLVEIHRLKAEMLQHYDNMEPVSLEALMQRTESGEVLLIDVRPKEEYDVDHIPGAISIPIDELEQHLSSLPANKDIVAYCRGPYCLMSAQAVEILKSRGIKAYRLEEGVHEWHHHVDPQRERWL
jgi:rhodanese-related sulfurtransferase/biotin operon repressor